MRDLKTTTTAILLATIWAGQAVSQQSPADVAGLLAQADVAAGQVLYADNCAVCHGENLEGQDNWQTQNEEGILPAPPHNKTGHTWHHPDAALFAYTKLGGAEFLKLQGIENFKSGMTGFAEIIDDQGIADVLAYIKSTWPERERQIQANRSNQ